jgi:hypothetical protein
MSRWKDTSKNKYNGKLYRTAIYDSWAGMKARCKNCRNPNFRNYGGRGISYCSKWKNFSGFLHDMWATHKKELTLDRIDVNGNYNKANCKWSTMKEQENNRTNNRVITIDKVTKTLAQWCEESKVKPSTIRQRYYVYGWNIERALSI